MKRSKWFLGAGLIIVLVTGILIYLVYSSRNVYVVDREGKQFLEQPQVSEISGRESYLLYAQVDSEEEAMEIADLYGITFLYYKHGIARYETDKDAVKLIEMGKEKGYPILMISQEINKFEKEGEE